MRRIDESVMANRLDRDSLSLVQSLDRESFREMRRESADSIRASRYRPAQQAGYKTAAYLSQHTDKDLGKREASI